jgi:hypothetical protein
VAVIIFPNNPVEGQIFPDSLTPGMPQYRWSSSTAKWELLSASGSGFSSPGVSPLSTSLGCRPLPSNQNTNITVSPNVGLTLTGRNLSTRYNTLIPNTVMSSPVCGATSELASVWKTRSLVQVLDAILFPTLQPTYTIPSISLSFSQSGIKEIGSSISQSLTVTGRKNDAGVFSALALRRNGSVISSVSNPAGTPYTNIPDQFGYANPNNPNYSYNHSYTNALTVTTGTTTWDGTGVFDAGLAKKDNKGTNDSRTPALLSPNAPQSSGSLTSSSVSINGIYPYFWGKTSSVPDAASIAADIEAGTTTKVLASASGTIEATFNAASEYIWFAHPASDTTKTKWFNTALNQGSIGPGNFILSPDIESVNSPEGYWSGVNYKIYISGYATITSGSIQLLNS